MVKLLYMSHIRFLPERLEEQMRKRGLETSSLAYRSDVSANMIYKMLSGDRPNVSAVILAKLAKTLNCSIEYLIDPGVESPAPRVDDLSPDIQAVVNIMYSMSPRQCRELIIMARLMSGDWWQVANLAANQVMEEKAAEIAMLYGDEAAQEMLAAAREAASIGDPTTVYRLLSRLDSPKQYTEETES